ncbi:hypothetical protein HDU81_010239 [Chytriomyces hyalinus]|nr:hypothetical protein HDU81_010239 [Chytriomyces hyalinus]
MNGVIIAETEGMENNRVLWDNITALAQYDFGPDFVRYAHDYAVAGFFDCTMLLALGLSQLASQSPDKLVQRKFQSEMNFALFQNLEYYGQIAPGLMTLDAFGDRQSRVTFTSLTGDYLNSTAFAISSDDYSSIVEYNYSAPAFYGGGTVPPPDGSVTITTVYYSMKSLEGRIILSLGMFVLIYISMFFHLGIPTSTTCKARILTLTIGIAMLLPPLIIKNAMLAWLFRQTHRLQKIFIDQMWSRVRLLVYGPVWAAACVFLAWACNASIRPVQLLQNDHAFFQCHICRDNGQVATIVLAFNVLIVLVLFVTAFFTCRIENADLNETSKLGFVVASVIGGYRLVQILSQAPDSLTDFKTVIIVWVINTLILFTVMGAPIFNLYQSRTRPPLKQTERSEQSSVTSGQTRNPHRGTRFIVSKYNFTQLNKTRIRCIFQIQTRMKLASPWFTAPASLHSSGDRKAWVALTNPTKAWCFPISESLGFVVEGTTAKLDLKHFSINQSVILEFADANEARAFEKEFVSALRAIQTFDEAPELPP